MAITATLKEKQAMLDGTVRIVATLTDDSKPAGAQVTLLPEFFLKAAEATQANVIARVNAIAFQGGGHAAAVAAVAALPAVGASIVLTPPTPPGPPTQAEINREAWLVKWHDLVGANKVIAAGHTALANDSTYVANKQAVITDFLPAYVRFV